MARDTGSRLHPQHVFGGDPLPLMKPSPDRRLLSTADSSECRLAASAPNCLIQGVSFLHDGSAIGEDNSQSIGKNYRDKPFNLSQKHRVSVGQRIADRLEALGGRADGFSQAWLARRTGLTQPTINALIRNPSASSKHLDKIANALQTSVSYLLGETEDPSAELPNMSIESTKQLLGIAMIPELVDLRYSMGGGADAEDPPYERRVPFRKAWLKQLTSSGPEGVFLAMGQGDSMMPTILDGDHVLVERTENEIDRQDAIWAIVYSGFIMLKRVRRLPDGTFRLLSDNPAISPIDASEGEIIIVGRVVWIGRKM